MTTITIIIIITPTNLNNFDDQYKRDWKSGHGQQESSKGYKMGADVGTLFARLLCLIMVNIVDAIIIMVFIRTLFAGLLFVIIIHDYHHSGFYQRLQGLEGGWPENFPLLNFHRFQPLSENDMEYTRGSPTLPSGTEVFHEELVKNTPFSKSSKQTRTKSGPKLQHQANSIQSDEF